eukprot:CAMPEP_0114562516 /NCGR_PEP_ID=MMETSP0114-20121206/12571_1 /TAXON_ID=31324 /ORGANISM="Goniomonas sp, Strain m" /LENGTH=120 /DNA_ID=CAMNT_0001748207 /DNA_START=24 /DNA_END=386 /DNA_ORIENTATION=+
MAAHSLETAELARTLDKMKVLPNLTDFLPRLAHNRHANKPPPSQQLSQILRHFLVTKNPLKLSSLPPASFQRFSDDQIRNLASTSPETAHSSGHRFAEESHKRRRDDEGSDSSALKRSRS